MLLQTSIEISYLVRILVVVAAVVLLLILGWYARSKFSARKAVRRMRRGVEMEKKAGAFLERKGYHIVSFQKQDTYTLLVDGVELPVNIRYDFIVSKRGKHYVAEVKTGKSAADIKTATTRRQLLEYGLFSKTDGILLVDMESEKIQQIEFPFTPKHVNRTMVFLFIALCLILIFLASLMQ